MNHARIGSFARRTRRLVILDPEREYHSIGVKWYGEGVSVHEVKLGHEFNAERFSVRTGDLVYNDMWARKGSVAVVPPHLNEAVASAHFPAFELDTEQIDARYLSLYLRSPAFWAACENASRGSTGRNQIKEEAFLSIEIPLPYLNEQRRIVARLDGLLEKVVEVMRLRDHTHAATSACYSQLVGEEYGGLARGGTSTLDAICLSVADGPHLTPKFQEDGVPFLFVGNVSTGTLTLGTSKFVTPEWFASMGKSRQPARGDLMYSVVGATLGVPAVVDTDQSFAFQRHVAILKPDRQQIDTRFLWHMLRSPQVYRTAWEKTTGTAQPTLPLGGLRALRVPVPCIQQQVEVRTYLDGVDRRLRAARVVQAEGRELALLRTVLLKAAFSGRL